MSTIEEDLKNMDESLRRLKIEYHIFFNGNRKKPPEDLRMRLERLVKQLSERSGMSQAQRFRYTTLLTRFYSYRNLWRRMLQKKEMGKEKEAELNRAAASTPKTDRSKEALCICLSDPESEKDKVKNLYDTLLRLKTENTDGPPVSYKQFARYIAKQTHHIQTQYGCTRVSYTIALEGGAVRFTAAAENL